MDAFNVKQAQAVMRQEMDRLRTKDEMLETLRRLKQQVEMAIGLVESDRLHKDTAERLAPGTFRIGDFAVCDRTKINPIKL